MKTKKKELIKVRKNKYNSIDNAYSQEDTNLIINTLDGSVSRLKAAKTISSKLGRTPTAIVARYNYVKGRLSHVKEFIEPKLDTSFIGTKQPLSIPESNSPTYLKQEQVTMYRAELSDSLHDKAQDAVKANIRAILDSYDSVRELENSTDKELHTWLYNNKEKINYLLNTNPLELWG